MVDSSKKLGISFLVLDCPSPSHKLKKWTLFKWNFVFGNPEKNLCIFCSKKWTVFRPSACRVPHSLLVAYEQAEAHELDASDAVSPRARLGITLSPSIFNQLLDCCSKRCTSWLAMRFNDDWVIWAFFRVFLPARELCILSLFHAVQGSRAQNLRRSLRLEFTRLLLLFDFIWSLEVGGLLCKNFIEHPFFLLKFLSNSWFPKSFDILSNQ